jgi:hypothetical protein
MPSAKEVALAKMVEEAFANTKPPDDNEIVTMVDGKDHCAECAEIMEQFKGKNWQDVPLEHLIWQKDALPLLMPSAFRHYLPAYMRAELLHGDQTDVIGESIFFNLTPPKEDEYQEWFINRVTGFTAKHQETIRDYILLFLGTEATTFDEDEGRTMRFWNLD